MQVFISADPAFDAAECASKIIQDRLKQQAQIRLLAATGNSQIQFLKYLTSRANIDWPRVELFHLDEYIGLAADHPASFGRYIRERIIQPTGMTKFHLIDGLADSASVIANLAEAISRAPVDIAFAGIGENAHLAFNDPPADFETKSPYLVVSLDDECRRQQVGEGWFDNVSQVPERAISISVWQLMQAKTVISVVPERRKANAVAACLEGSITPDLPASRLRLHPDARLYLDRESACRLNPDVLRRYGAKVNG